MKRIIISLDLSSNSLEDAAVKLIRLKIWIIIIAFNFSMMTLGYWTGERVGLAISFFISIFLSGLLFFWGDLLILEKMKAQPLVGQDPWGLGELFRSVLLLQKDKNVLNTLSPPKLYLLNIPQPQVFCVVQSWHKVSFCFTQGLLEKLNTHELRAVCALLISHSQRLRSFRFLFFAIIINCFIASLNLLDKILPSPFKIHAFRHYFLKLFMKIMNPGSDIYESDSRASEILHDRFSVGKTLILLNNYSFLSPMPFSFDSHFIFLTHGEMRPVISQRIQKLVGYYPL